MAMGVYHFFQTHPDFVVCFVYVLMIVLLIYARQAGKSVAFSGAGSLKQWSLQYDFILLSDWWGSLDTADPSMDPLVGLADGHHFFGGKCHWHKFWTRRFIPWNGHEATVPVDIFPWHCIELFTFILAQHWRAFFFKKNLWDPQNHNDEGKKPPTWCWKFIWCVWKWGIPWYTPFIYWGKWWLILLND